MTTYPLALEVIYHRAVGVTQAGHHNGNTCVPGNIKLVTAQTEKMFYTKPVGNEIDDTTSNNNNDGLNIMTTELTLLIMSVGLLMLTLVIQGSAGVISNGLLTQAGPRDTLPEQGVFHARVTRLRANMMENLLLFAPLVLVAHAANVTNDMTILGAQLFFFGRLAHGIVYLAGWPLIRPVCFAIAWAGIIMIAVQLLT